MSVHYDVQVTRYAISQIRDIRDYISKVLVEPQTATRVLATLKKEMQSLSFMPNRISLTPEEPWHANGIHRMSVKNFFIYFLVDEESSTVLITAVTYARREQERQLSEMSIE